MIAVLLGLGCTPKPPAPLTPTAPRDEPVFAPSELGRWEGVLPTEPPTPIRATVTAQEASLGIGDRVLPAKAARIGSSFMLEVPAIGVKVVGTLFGDRFQGQWRQGSQVRPLTLLRQVER